MELNLKNVVLFLISLCVIVLFLLLIFNKNKKTINYDNVKTSRDNYPVYEVDDLVKLSNDSEWYVLKENTSKDRDVYLISKNKTNNEVVEDTYYYLKDKYLDSLCNSLFVSRKEISEVRLLNSGDICELYKSDCSNFNVKFDTSKYKLLENATMVDFNLDNKKYSLCSEGFCENNSNDIRVIIRIAKFFIKEDIEKED